MPKQLNNGRVTQSLQSAFGFKGRYIPMLDEVIVPVYQIADPVPAEPSLTYAGRFFFDISVTDGDFPRLRFRNPPGSGVLMQLSGVSIGAIKGAGASQEAEMTGFIVPEAVSSIDFPTLLTATKRDTRNVQESRLVISTGLSNQAAGTTPDTLGTALVITEAGFTELTTGPGNFPRQPPTVIGPGFSLDMLGSGPDSEGINALSFLANVAWAEVPTGGLDIPA